MIIINTIIIIIIIITIVKINTGLYESKNNNFKNCLIAVKKSIYSLKTTSVDR